MQNMSRRQKSQRPSMASTIVVNDWSHYEARAEAEDKVNVRPQELQLYKQLERTHTDLERQRYTSLKKVDDRMDGLRSNMADLRIVTTPLVTRQHTAGNS